MDLQLLLQQYLAKRQQSELLEAEIKQIQTAILDHPDFDKAVIDGYEITRAIRTSKVIKDNALIPAEYKSKVFNHNSMIAKEPSTRARVQKQLMSEYPEYVSEVINDDKLLEDHPELFETKETKFLKVSKAK